MSVYSINNHRTHLFWFKSKKKMVTCTKVKPSIILSKKKKKNLALFNEDNPPKLLVQLGGVYKINNPSFFYSFFFQVAKILLSSQPNQRNINNENLRYLFAI